MPETVMAAIRPGLTSFQPKRLTRLTSWSTASRMATDTSSCSPWLPTATDSTSSTAISASQTSSDRRVSREKRTPASFLHPRPMPSTARPSPLARATKGFFALGRWPRAAASCSMQSCPLPGTKRNLGTASTRSRTMAISSSTVKMPPAHSPGPALCSNPPPPGGAASSASTSSTTTAPSQSPSAFRSCFMSTPL